MKKFLNILLLVEKRLITVAMLIMVIAISLATITRFTDTGSIPWAEELSRYSMSWMIFIGIAVGARNNKLYTVENLVNLFPKSTRRFFYVLRTTIIVAFCIVMSCISFQLIIALKRMGQVSAALQIPMWIVYLSIPIGLVLIAIHSIEFSVENRWGLGIDEEKIDFDKYV